MAEALRSEAAPRTSAPADAGTLDGARTAPPLAVAGAWPGVSVVMVVRNEAAHLRSAVERIWAQEYPGEVEVVVAVGPSRDRTLEIAHELAAADPRMRVVDNLTGATPTGLNAAIRASRHPVVVRVDGHSLLSPGYVQRAVRLLEHTGADNVGGVMAAEGVTTVQRAIATAMCSRLGVGSAPFHTGGEPGPADTVYLGVFRRSGLEEVGGYDPAYLRAQDAELNHRLRAAGGLVWFDPLLTVTYRPRASFSALASQYLHYGRWRRVVMRQHPDSVRLRYLAPPALVVALLTSLVLLALRRPEGLVLPLGYAALLLAGTAFIGHGLAVRSRLLLPLVMATMHLAWGFGFLTSPRGLGRMRNRQPPAEPPSGQAPRPVVVAAEQPSAPADQAVSAQP